MFGHEGAIRSQDPRGSDRALPKRESRGRLRRRSPSRPFWHVLVGLHRTTGTTSVRV